MRSTSRRIRGVTEGGKGGGGRGREEGWCERSTQMLKMWEQARREGNGNAACDRHGARNISSPGREAVCAKHFTSDLRRHWRGESDGGQGRGGESA